jgi:phage shock protein PspC (stress-responsive transcriptional regulator)
VNDRLYRSVDDRILAGVCAGLADRLGIDPALVRIAWVLLTLASNGVFLIIYIVMAFVVPEEDDLAAFPAPPTVATGVTTPAATGADMGSSAASGEAAAGLGSTAPDPAAAPVSTAAPAGWVMPQSASQWRAQSRAERRAARAARRAEGKPGQATLVLGVILILLGGWFLLEQYVPAFDAGRFWPFIVIGLGVVLLAFAFGARPGGKPEGQP